MKISTKGRYALRMLLDLAQNQGDGFVALKDVAERQNVSKKYLEQIVPMLNKAGILAASRGFQGGYRLAQAPDRCTVGAVLRVTEGSIAPVSCLDDAVNQCAHCRECVTLDLWEQVDKAIANVVDHVTLADLVDKQHRIEKRRRAQRKAANTEATNPISQ